MVDWPGLFKWSMAYQDQTHSTQFAPMSEEKKKFLQNALEEFSFDEIKRMKEVVAELAKDEQKTPEDGEKRENLLYELEDLVEGLENARDLHRIGGFSVLINTMLNSSYERVRNQAYLVFASCCQNNIEVQLIATELGAPLLMNSVLNETVTRNQESCVAALSSYLRGENLKGKRRFIDWLGVEFLLKILSEKEKFSSLKLQSKIFFLIQDLVFYDDKLGFPDMISYTKTSGDIAAVDYKNKDDSVKKEGGLISLKPQQEEHKSEPKPETDNEEHKAKDPTTAEGNEERNLQDYKNIVKRKLIEKNFPKILESYLTKEELKSKLTLRSSALSTLLSLVEFDKDLKLEISMIAELKDLKEEFLSKNKEEENLYDIEIELVTNILKAQAN